ncbi:16S rRNA (cytidine(1402)-2'-O)-methyltransferase [Pelagibacterales bacterium SAG-MED47]|nr:16S rRNA (cytidine(1402)-2'-O)-methyltransferase [Pelagibacterales bacterium SAG-MED47]
MTLDYKSNNNEIKKGLYLVSTPIGNLEDITLRAIETLSKSNYILCEDTRISQNLFKRYKIQSKLISNHKFNEKKNLSKIIGLLKSGSIISLVSDAGTPSISDPGAKIVNECINNNIRVTPIPGPSAVSTAVAISGFDEKFFFYGFFPEKVKTISEDLNILAELDCSIVFFISPKKINRNIKNLKKFFSGRRILICREMSKIYEEFIRVEIDQLQEFDKELKGEITLVVSEQKEKKKKLQKLSESDKRNINKMMNKFSIKEIVNLVSFNNKIPKKEIYNYCLKIKDEN